MHRCISGDEIQSIYSYLAPVLFGAALILLALTLYVHRRKQGHAASEDETTRRYHDIILSIDGIVWESDAETQQTTLVSEGAVRLLGYPLSRWTEGTNFWRQSMHPDDADMVVQELADMIAENNQGQHTSRVLTYRMFTADGRLVWMQSTVNVVLENGRVKLLRGLSLDITQRHLREMRVAEEERFIRTIADNLPAVVTYWTRDLYCTFANRSVTDWFDRDPARMVGLHMREQLGDELFERDYPFVQGVLAGEPQQFERNLVRADGVAIQVVAQYVPDTVDGEVRGFFALVSDITAVKKNETQLRLLEKAIAGLSDIVVILEASSEAEGGSRIAYVNDAFERQLGYTREEVIGQSPRLLLNPSTSSEDRDLIRKTLAAGEVVYRESVHNTKSGVAVPFDINITPLINSEGRLSHVVSIMRDISDRKRQEQEKQDAAKRLSESEAFANLVLQYVDAVITVSDRNRNLLRVNRKAELISGYSEAELKDPAILARIVPDEELAEVERIRRSDDMRAFPIIHVNHWVGRSGEKRLLRWANVALADERGDLSLIIAIGFDITDQRRHEQALISAKNQAETASRAKSSFLATMSHELRTPLNAIIGFSDVMSLQSFGPIENKKYIEYVNDIRNSGRQLLSIINDILDLSRVEAGKQELKIESITLAEIWPQIASGLDAAAVAKGIHISVPQNLQALTFMADRRAVMQIITNLISNAIKFTQAGGEIHLEQHQSGDGGTFILAVRDTGRGIPQGRLKDVLKPFIQVSNTYSRDAGGVGLGLAICNSLATSMRGHIDIASELGRGTTVSVHLPAAVQISAPLPPGYPLIGHVPPSND